MLGITRSIVNRARYAPALRSLTVKAFAAAFVLGPLGLISASAADTHMPRDPTLRTLVQELTIEAGQALIDGELPSDRPDAAQRFPYEIDADLIQQAIIRPVHNEPFVDAYIRWQLTAYEPDLPAMEWREYIEMLNALPPMVENPKADRGLTETLGQLDDAGPLPEIYHEQLREMKDNLESRADVAQTRNQPAAELRRWVRHATEDQPARRVMSLIEECAATVEAGWSTRSIKTNLTRALAEAGKSGELSDEQKNVLAAQLDHLQGMERRFVNQITFLADGSINVQFSRARVTARDVERWKMHLAGQDPDEQDDR